MTSLSADHLWKVARLSPGQLLDVRPDDVLCDGWFRKCETYRGGGGYDRFPEISEKVFGKRHHSQFVVQLYGCNLDCPYCYVTREGVWGEYRKFSTTEIVDAFRESAARHDTTVFHLMGGAPALQITHWSEIVSALDSLRMDWVFHSDMLLSERDYPASALARLARERVLIAVDIKGGTPEEHRRNTRKEMPTERIWSNLTRLEACDVPFYITFTAVADVDLFWREYERRFPARVERRRSDAFTINLIDYSALKHVDDVPWGAQLKD